MGHRPHIIAVLVALAVGGCLGSPEPPTCEELAPGAAGCPLPDEGAPDAGPVDARPVDAAPPIDAARDGAPPDAAPVDAAPPDAIPDMACVDELCNGIDDDCDGVVDERLGGGFCASGTGQCRSEGVESCLDGALVCEAEVIPAMVEACNGLDDDCDGRNDETLVFDTPEIRVAPMPRAARPSVATLDQWSAVAHPVTIPADPAAGVLEASEAVALHLFDGQGRSLQTLEFGHGARAITAWTVTWFNYGAPSGFGVLWGEERLVADRVQYGLYMAMAFPSADGFGRVDDPIRLAESPGPIDVVDAVDGSSGVALAWVAGGAGRYGFLSFASSPPAMRLVDLGVDELSATTVSLGEARGDVMLVFTVHGPAAGSRRVVMVRVEDSDGLVDAPVELAAGPDVGPASIAADLNDMVIAWTDSVDGAERVRMSIFERSGDPIAGPLDLTDGRWPVSDVRLTKDDELVGVAWSEARPGAAPALRFTQVVEDLEGMWGRRGAELTPTGDMARPGLLELAGKDHFAAAWVDTRDGAPAVYLRSGLFDCQRDGVAAQ